MPSPAGAASEPTPSPSPSWWRRALPFAIAVVLVALVLARLDPHVFIAALARVDGPAYAASAAAFVLALLSADTFATALVYRRAALPISLRDFFILRGASYLPSLLNHHVGQAFIAVSLSRAHGVPLARVAGATLVVYASWLGCLLALAAVAFPLYGLPLAWSALALAPGVLYLALLAARPAALTRLRLLAPLFDAGIGGHLVALAARLPHLAVLFVGTWLPFRFFDVRIPLGAAALYVPILMVAVTLPITPQGFGTRDVLAAALFERFAEGAAREERLAAIAAATTSWAVAITLVEVVLGLALLRAALPGAWGPPGGAREDGVDPGA